MEGGGLGVGAAASGGDGSSWRRGAVGGARREEMRWREVVWAWARRREEATAASRAGTAAGERHCLAAATGVGIADR